jgi:hypothetical protein
VVDLAILQQICDELLGIDFKVLPPTDYESMVKQNLQIPDAMNPQLTDFVAKITSEFDKSETHITLKNQRTGTKPGNSGLRKDKFDATYLPMLFGRIRTVRVTVKLLAEKGLLDDEIPNGFCRLSGTDLKLPLSRERRRRRQRKPKPETRTSIINSTSGTEM